MSDKYITITCQYTDQPWYDTWHDYGMQKTYL